MIYPRETPLLDVTELVPNIMAWLDTLTLSMGNWTSREQIRQEYAALNITRSLIFHHTPQLDLLNRMLREKQELVLIGFDALQIPVTRIVYSYLPGG